MEFNKYKCTDYTEKTTLFYKYKIRNMFNGHAARKKESD